MSFIVLFTSSRSATTRYPFADAVSTSETDGPGEDVYYYAFHAVAPNLATTHHTALEPKRPAEKRRGGPPTRVTAIPFRAAIAEIVRRARDGRRRALAPDCHLATMSHILLSSSSMRGDAPARGSAISRMTTLIEMECRPDGQSGVGLWNRGSADGLTTECRWEVERKQLARFS